MRRILITGGSGFIASWLTGTLAKISGVEIYLLHRQKLQKTPQIKGCHNIYCDIRDAKSLLNVLGRIEFNYVIHLAAQSRNQVSEDSRIETFETNIQGTWNLLKACEGKSLKGFILFSSSLVYANNNTSLIKESSGLYSNNTYGISKICSENIAQYYSDTCKMPLIIVRVGMVFGGRDRNITRLVPYIINALLCEKKINIRSSKNVLLDPIYILELIEGIIKILFYFDTNKVTNEIFNLSGGNPIRMENFIEYILDIFGKEGIVPVYGNERASSRVLSVDKFREKVGLPRSYDIKEALRETLSWYVDDRSGKGNNEKVRV